MVMTAATSCCREAVITVTWHHYGCADPGHASATNGFVPSGQEDKIDVAS